MSSEIRRKLHTDWPYILKYNWLFLVLKYKTVLLGVIAIEIISWTISTIYLSELHFSGLRRFKGIFFSRFINPGIDVVKQVDPCSISTDGRHTGIRWRFAIIFALSIIFSFIWSRQNLSFFESFFQSIKSYWFLIIINKLYGNWCPEL